MWCPACAWLIEETLKRQPGILVACCSFSTDRVRCDYNPVLTSPREIISRIAGLGYTPALPGREGGAQEKRREYIRFGVSAFLTMNVMMLSFALYSGFFTELSPESIGALSWPTFIMATVVLAYGGSRIFRRAWSGMTSAAFGMETLIGVGSLSSFLYSTFNLLQGSIHLYFDTASMLITLLLIGRLLERRARDEVQEDLASFLSLRPTKVRILSSEFPEGRYRAADALQQGDLFRVEEGEILAADGTVVAGAGALDESSLTGEPMPVSMTSGGRARSGSRVQRGTFTIKAEAVGPDSTLGQMIAITEQALAQKNPLETKTDRLLRWFVPAVIALALTTGTVCLMVGVKLEGAIVRAVTVMVISCPCTLGIAMPLARVAAISLAGKRGILVRDFSAFERSARIDTFVLDKTGTVTEGTWALVEIRLAGDLSRELALALAASLESHGDHPVAREIVRRAEEEGLPPVELAAVRVSENGIAGVFRGAEVKIGSAGFAAPQLDGTHVAALGGGCPEHSSVFLTVAGRLGAVFLFGDRIKGAATETVQGLRSMGFPIALVSGDGEATTAAIARRIGITEAHGSLLPSAKAAYVAELQREGRIVAMVGDGINDAPAMVQADLAIAIHSDGPLGKEVAHLSLMRGEPSQIIGFLKLAGRVRGKIRQNLVCSLVYNVISIPVAMGGLLTPIVAVSAMLLSSLTVIGNTLILTKRA
jgi:heavy metal translocating P-type ATPase